ncbi:MAG: hypothetical protein ACT6FF_00320 [Methanosarcinaceae archaeon]
MSSGNKYCVNCKYEEATKSITEMWKAEELGIDPGELPARWCNYYGKYIDAAKAQGVRRREDGTYEEDVWCGAFEHY